MAEAMKRLLKDKFLGIQAKLVFPLAVTIILLVAFLSPITNQVINSQIEEDADRRLIEIADSVGLLVENSEALAKNNASLLSKQPEITDAFIDISTSQETLADIKASLNLQELSLYSANYKPGDQAYYYGGPTVARRLQVSEDAEKIRNELIEAALKSKTAESGVAVSPQNSQIIGVAPVISQQTGRTLGVVFAAFYMDQAYTDELSRTVNTDIAIVRDNAVIATTIDPAAGYENLINRGWLNETESPTATVDYQDGTSYRLLASQLTISGEDQGWVLVAQPVENLFAIRRNLQTIILTVTGIFGLTALWFWVAAFLAFTRPLAQLTDATTHMSQGDLNQKVNTDYLIFKDEITILSENFNSMAENLGESYASLEERVEQRTQELAVARDEAVAANKSKSEFVSLVSHELKLPMTSIKGYSDLMLSGATGELNANQSNFLGTIRNNVDRMATLVSDLADISRIESGNLRLELREVPVWDVIDEVVNLTRTQYNTKNQTIEINIPKELPKSWCDRNRLAQILTNLISNANKYTPEGGKVNVNAVRVDGNMIQISIKDNGLGMTPEDQHKLFSKFFRSADEKVREAPGTGLGLSITKNLIEMQGGKVWFESEFRKGTTFHFTVPISLAGNPMQA